MGNQAEVINNIFVRLEENLTENPEMYNLATYKVTVTLW